MSWTSSFFGAHHLRTLAAGVSLLALACTGCSDWLGLGDLEFSDSQSEGLQDEDKGPVLIGAGGALVTGPDHATGSIWDDFPQSWPANALFVFEPIVVPELSYYWVYNPEERTLSTNQLRANADLVGKRTWAADLQWSHVFLLETSQGPELIGYESSSGIWERISNFKPDGSFDAVREAGNLHTELMVARWGEQQLFFGYDRADGSCRMVAAADEYEVATYNCLLQPGLDQLVAVRFSGVDGILAYTKSSGEASFYAFDEAQPEGLSLRDSWQFVSDAMIWVSLDEKTGDNVIYFYDSATGEHSASSPELADGTWSAQLFVPDISLRQDLVGISVVRVEGDEALVTFNGAVARYVSSSGDMTPVIR